MNPIFMQNMAIMLSKPPEKIVLSIALSPTRQAVLGLFTDENPVWNRRMLLGTGIDNVMKNTAWLLSNKLLNSRRNVHKGSSYFLSNQAL